MINPLAALRKGEETPALRVCLVPQNYVLRVMAQVLNGSYCVAGVRCVSPSVLLTGFAFPSFLFFPLAAADLRFWACLENLLSAGCQL